MPRFSANLSMLFTEVPFLERFDTARKASFRAVEFWSPYEYPKKMIAEAKGDLTIVVFNTAPGNAAAGEWGLSALPDRVADFRRNFDQALDYAVDLDVPSIHVLASNVANEDRRRARDVFLDNVIYAADCAAQHGVSILIEPLNRFDRPNYLVNDLDTAASILREADRPNVRILFDIFHVQMMSGNILRSLREYRPLIGHIQIASVPDRTEPNEGELNCSIILREIDLVNWDGWVGCEYRPKLDTVSGLGWLKAFTQTHLSA